MTTDALPDNTGYVAAAYLVFLALLLVYVVIMVVRQSRLQREIVELDALADRVVEERARRVEEHVA